MRFSLSLLTLLALAGCDSAGTDNPLAAPSEGAAGSAASGGKSSGSGGKAGGPATVTCQKGAIVCDGKTKQVCDGNGGFSEQTPCDTACSPGVGCTVCTPGQATCDGGVSKFCKSDGTGFEEEVCDPEQGSSCGSNGRCTGVCSRVALGQSYIGCEYWPTVTSNAGLFSGFSFAVAVSNTGMQPANVRVFKGPNAVTNVTIAPGAVETIKLPWVDALKNDTGAVQSPEDWENAFTSDYVATGAYQLKSDQPVTVYQFNPLDFEIPDPGGCPAQPGLTAQGKCNSFTNDASLLLPTNSLGYEYIASSYVTFRIATTPPFPNQPYALSTPGFVTIVATQPDTHVKLTAGGAVRAGNGWPALAQGESREFALGRGDVFQMMSASVPDNEVSDCKTIPGSGGSTRTLCAVSQKYDLTGTHITADKPIQVIGGHDCTFVPYSDFACDHIEESMFPLNTWGVEVFVTAPQAVKGAATGDGTADKQYVRVLSGDDGNMVTLDPPLFPGGVLNKGQYADIKLDATDFVVRGTRRLLVTQYMAGGDVIDPANSGKPTSKGDPSMSLAIPREQYRKEYSFLAPASYTYNFANIIAENGSVITLDGNPVMSAPHPIGQSGWSVIRAPIAGGAHKISSEKPFGIVVYGYGAYTSYMYPGGLNLEQVDILK